uniref:Ovule protein n=1 Tax=Schistosoma curassoni TaxID=6186 RepID=A0A183KIV0_9TREM
LFIFNVNQLVGFFLLIQHSKVNCIFSIPYIKNPLVLQLVYLYDAVWVQYANVHLLCLQLGNLLIAHIYYVRITVLLIFSYIVSLHRHVVE